MFVRVVSCGEWVSPRNVEKTTRCVEGRLFFIYFNTHFFYWLVNLVGLLKFYNETNLSIGKESRGSFSRVFPISSFSASEIMKIDTSKRGFFFPRKTCRHLKFDGRERRKSEKYLEIVWTRSVDTGSSLILLGNEVMRRHVPFSWRINLSTRSPNHKDSIRTQLLNRGNLSNRFQVSSYVSKSLVHGPKEKEKRSFLKINCTYKNIKNFQNFSILIYSVF